MINTDDLVARFKIVMADLLAKTNASRTTLRLDVEERGFSVNSVVAEALAPGVKSIAAERTMPQHKTQTAGYLEQHRKILVQNDCANAELQPPKELMQIYGTKAQMLAPLERGGRLAGWISVHYNPSTREWTPQDVTALEAAVASTQQELDAMSASTMPGASADKTEPARTEAPIDSARLHATKKVPEPDSLGG